MRADRLLIAAVLACAAVSGSILLLILFFVLREALPALETIEPWRFFTDPSWHPTRGSYRLVPMLAGTAFSSMGALVLAAPLGIASSVFSCFYAPAPVSRWYRRLVGLLAGIPSVTYGLWGLVVLVPLVAKLGGSGQCLLAAVVILALMILPTVALSADAALRSVPAAPLQAAAALGLGRWATIRRIALPLARPAISAGLLLATARAVGETMAVLMVAGNVARVPLHVLDPMRTLTANVALEMGYATEGHRAVLFASGLLLMAAVTVLLVLVEWRRRPRHG